MQDLKALCRLRYRLAKFLLVRFLSADKLASVNRRLHDMIDKGFAEYAHTVCVVGSRSDCKVALQYYSYVNATQRESAP